MARPIALVLVLVTALATVGCDRDLSGPVAPNPEQPTPTEPATMISQAAKAYLDTILEII